MRAYVIFNVFFLVSIVFFFCNFAVSHSYVICTPIFHLFQRDCCCCDVNAVSNFGSSYATTTKFNKNKKRAKQQTSKLILVIVSKWCVYLFYLTFMLRYALDIVSYFSGFLFLWRDRTQFDTHIHLHICDSYYPISANDFLRLFLFFPSYYSIFYLLFYLYDCTNTMYLR